MAHMISGIQQMGIGIPDVHQAWKWYRNHLGMDVPIFEEAATAGLMLPYTGGMPHDRHAILALNMQGGGGFEIWQYTSRTPQPPSFEPYYGDLGINVCKIKTRNIDEAFKFLQSKGCVISPKIEQNSNGRQHFYLRDPYGNLFQVIEFDTFFLKSKAVTGGVCGATIGVSDIDASLKLYRDVLGYDQILFDETGTFEDLEGINPENCTYRRVALRHSRERSGAFSRLLGPTEIELVQNKSRAGKKIYENRFWGDLGFIHLCFDVTDMNALQVNCEAAGFPFTVDSASSFDMGEAAGHFTYIEDADGTLIEFVETHKIPIMKKLGWYLNLKKRNASKALPNWMLGALSLNRKKD
ncbi:MAG: VOC family protein [Flavobacteriales bacterium]|nr:VOC family protein [Bacteroidota bacterium]MCB9241511.1 VOC family protein [Flavobacteriales bacterium]